MRRLMNNIASDGVYYYTYEIYINDPDSGLYQHYYYGKHETKNINDNYYGSGKLIRRYIKKHGTQKLQKTILSFYPNREELNNAEQLLINKKFSELGSLCLNLHEGGSGGHWVEYCSSEELERRRQLVISGVYKKTTSESRHFNALNAGLSKRNATQEQRSRWSENMKNAYKNMTPEKKKEKYKKVSESLKKFYSNPDNMTKREDMLKRNIETNKRVSREWRTQFYELFKCTPESFRASGNMGNALALFKKIKNLPKGDAINEVDRFMESIDC